MIPLQDKLHEINVKSDDYKLYLKEQGYSEEKAEKAALGLKTLFWQAGEQKEYLQEQIDSGIHDGKQFTMLVGFAYTILDSLSDIADLACIGSKDGTGYTVYCDTHFIHNIKLYGKRTKDKKTNDFEYFRFLRSFICAHPLGSNYETTVDGFIPGTYAYCKFVDYIGDRPFEYTRPEGADFWVQMLSDNNSWNDDFYICSSEIWQYVNYRYEQLINTIHSTMMTRIDKTMELLRSRTIPSLQPTANLSDIDTLLIEDYKRNGHHKYGLLTYKVALEHIMKEPVSPYSHHLYTFIWNGVNNIRNSIQDMSTELFDFHSDVHQLLYDIGCDHNQCNNCLELDNTDYEGTLTDISGEYTQTPTPDQRRQMFDSLLSDDEIKAMSRDERIDVVSAFYVKYQRLPRTEVAKLYFVIVLPDFVSKYDLLEPLINHDNYQLLLEITGCAIDYKSFIQEV